MKTILLYISAIMVCFGMCIDNNPELMAAIIFPFGFIMYALLHDKSDEEIGKITGATWIKNKTGIDFLSEE